MTFEKKVVDSIATGKKEVHFILKQPEGAPDFRIIADGAGVRFKGESCEFWGQGGAEVLAQTIGAAFTEYQRMRPKFATNMAGH